jgi:hypothetical protein
VVGRVRLRDWDRGSRQHLGGAMNTREQVLDLVVFGFVLGMLVMYVTMRVTPL